MTGIIIEIGPAAVRGPGDVDTEMSRIALDCIDDEIALLDDRPVQVDQLWRTILGSTRGVGAGPVRLVCPAWWPARRVDRIRAAARAAAMDDDEAVVVLARAGVLSSGLSTASSTVVEIAPEFIVLSCMGTIAAAIPRLGGVDAVVAAVVDAVGRPAEVLVDTPLGVDGATELGVAIAAGIRATGVAVAIADQNLVLRNATAQGARAPGEPAPGRVTWRSPARGRRSAAALVGTASAATMVCIALISGPVGGGAEDTAMTVLVEGRVGVRVPDGWVVERITSGPGSARLQVVSPADPDSAVLIVQSQNPFGQDLPAAAQVLRRALQGQPADVFVDFDPAGHREGKPAITYTERRAARHIQWTVLLDRDVRIAVGCQSPPGRERLVQPACAEAIRSAHAVF